MSVFSPHERFFSVGLSTSILAVCEGVSIDPGTFSSLSTSIPAAATIPATSPEWRGRGG